MIAQKLSGKSKLVTIGACIANGIEGKPENQQRQDIVIARRMSTTLVLVELYSAKWIFALLKVYFRAYFQKWQPTKAVNRSIKKLFLKISQYS